MLNGIAPIILFNFFKLSPKLTASLNKIPLIEDALAMFPLVPIPLYLDEKITGLYIESESKNIDIETDTETIKDGSEPDETQRALNSSVTIQMIANSSSLGLTLLSAMMDVILPKVTSKEYSISYLHGAVTVFNGKLLSFAIDQNSDNNLYRITLNLTQGTKKTIPGVSVPTVGKTTGVLPL